MIMCLGCKRISPRDSLFCRNCAKSLGKRFCPEQHDSPLDASACTTCGSRKLTPGSSSFNLRPLTWLALAPSLYGAFVIVLRPVLSGIAGWASNAGWIILTGLIQLAFWSFILSIFVGDRGRQLIHHFWMRALNLLFDILSSVFRLLWTLMNRKLPKS